MGHDKSVPASCESMSYHFNIYPATGRVRFEKTATTRRATRLSLPILSTGARLPHLPTVARLSRRPCFIGRRRG
jgi:hypothetical protein